MERAREELQGKARAEGGLRISHPEKCLKKERSTGGKTTHWGLHLTLLPDSHYQNVPLLVKKSHLAHEKIPDTKKIPTHF